jgi:hypothetical protein
MAVPLAARDLFMDKLLAVMESGGSSVRINVGNSSYDGTGTFGNDANCIGTGNGSFTNASAVISLDSAVNITVPSDDSYTVDKVFITDGSSVDGTTDTVLFQSTGLSTSNDTDYTVGGTWVVNSFTINISEV